MNLLQLCCTLLISTAVYSQENTSNSSSCDKGDRRIKLHLLNILPFPGGRSDSGWDRAYELIPAAQLAADHINKANNSNFLQGYKLELVSVDSEGCGISNINKGLVNTFARVLDPKHSLNVVGMAGLFCSSVTGVLASIFSFPNVTYLQVAGSTTPAHRNFTQFPWLVHLISSSTVFNDAVFALMKTFGWQKIGLIHDSIGIFFLSIANDFVDRIRLSTDFNLTARIPVTVNSIGGTFTNLINSGTRIILVVGNIPESVKFMCRAYQQNAYYPGYVYIILSRPLIDFISNTQLTDCTQSQIRDILEGAIIVDYGLVSGSTSKLVSNLTYAEYYQEYLIRLSEMESTKNVTLDKDNVYANSMYDEVWAFALALKASFGKTEGIINLKNLSTEHTRQFAEIMKSNLVEITFQGASGYIKFDEQQEDNSEVRIYQVINGSQEQIGKYDKDLNDSIILLRDISLPGDSFETVARFLPSWLSIVFNIITSFCVVFTSLVLLFMIVYRSRPEVKSSSLYLNLFIFAGCYMIFIGAEMRTVTRGYAILNDSIFTLTCNMEVWFGSTGMNLIFSTLLVRLLRIRKIFKAYGKVSKYWGDKYLILIVLLLCCGGLIILGIWTINDTIRKSTTTEYIFQGKSPYFEIHSICSSRNLGIWLAAAFSYSGIIIAIVASLAIQTRKIKLINFKDTKKVNAYIFLIIITLCILMPMWYIVDTVIGNDIGGHIMITTAFIAVGFLCQLFIFVPRVYATLCNIKAENLERKHGISLNNIKPRARQFSAL